MSLPDATFEHEIHPNVFAVGASPGTPLGSLQRSPRPPS